MEKGGEGYKKVKIMIKLLLLPEDSVKDAELVGKIRKAALSFDPDAKVEQMMLRVAMVTASASAVQALTAPQGVLDSPDFKVFHDVQFQTMS